MTARLLIIGDVHGHLTALDAVLAAARLGAEDRVVLLGDYVDGGPDSAGVLGRVLQLERREGTAALLGNHDAMMRAALAYGDPARLDAWFGMGGRAALASYRGAGGPGRATGLDERRAGGEDARHGGRPHARSGPRSDSRSAVGAGAASIREAIEAVPVSHMGLLMRLRLVYETAHYIFVHGGVRADAPAAAQPEEILLWQKIGAAEPHESGKLVVCGHSRQMDGRPIDLGHTVCLDTNMKGGGWLTCLELFEATEAGASPAVGPWRYWQSDAAGHVREGLLRGSGAGERGRAYPRGP